MLRWFPRLQVATASFSCSPLDLNFLDPYFIFMYMHYNHCHWVTAHLQSIFSFDDQRVFSHFECIHVIISECIQEFILNECCVYLWSNLQQFHLSYTCFILSLLLHFRLIMYFLQLLTDKLQLFESRFSAPSVVERGWGWGGVGKAAAKYRDPWTGRGPGLHYVAYIFEFLDGTCGRRPSCLRSSLRLFPYFFPMPMCPCWESIKSFYFFSPPGSEPAFGGPWLHPHRSVDDVISLYHFNNVSLTFFF